MIEDLTPHEKRALALAVWMPYWDTRQDEAAARSAARKLGLTEPEEEYD
jgi:hypothetical protein